MSELHEAALAGDTAKVTALLASGKDVNEKDEDGKTPLHNCAQEGHLECMQFLISKGADVNAKDSGENTALHKAAFRGNKPCVELLLEKGAATEKNKLGKSPLDMALRRNYKEIIELLNQAPGGVKPTPAPAPVTAVPPPEEAKTPARRAQPVTTKEATTPKEEPAKASESEKSSPPLSKAAAARAAAERAAQQVATGPTVTTNPQTPTATSTLTSSSSTTGVVHQSSSASLPVHASSPISSSAVVHHAAATSSTTSLAHANPNSNDVLFWSSKDVAEFLSSVGFAEYRENFLLNHVSGRDFYELSLADNGLQLMKSELGIHSYGHRKQILRQMSNLQQFKSVESHLPSFVLVRDSNPHSPFSSVHLVSTSFVQLKATVAAKFGINPAQIRDILTLNTNPKMRIQDDTDVQRLILNQQLEVIF